MEKNKNKEVAYGVKTLSVKVDDIDDEKGIVKGYFASFNTIDSDGDVIRKGAFAKSILENGPSAKGNRRIAHLRNHSWDRQIGKILELFEDEKGLGFVSQLGRSTEGQDALADYQDEILREHSIGFNYIWDKMEFVEDSEFSEHGHYEVNEVKLWEGSGVTFGANSLTPVIEAAKSSGDYLPLMKEIEQHESNFEKALRNGKGTDMRLEEIEARFKQIQQLRNSLLEEKPSIKDTLKKEADKKKELSKKNTFYQNLIK